MPCPEGGEPEVEEDIAESDSDNEPPFMKFADACFDDYPGPSGAISWARCWRSTFCAHGANRLEADMVLLNSFVASHGLRPGPMLRLMAEELDIIVSPAFAQRVFGPRLEWAPVD